MPSNRVDSWLARWANRGRRLPSHGIECQQVTTPVGTVRVFDSATDSANRPVVVFAPDGPTVIEHHAALFALLTPHFRVVCFDLPGFGFSIPQANHTHALDQGAAAVLGVLDQLRIARAVFAFSCANGFYALRAERIAPQRFDGLILAQTSGLAVMDAWTRGAVPWPLWIPVLGQILGWFGRQKTAPLWYDIALPRGVDRSKFYRTGCARSRRLLLPGERSAGLGQGSCRGLYWGHCPMHNGLA